MNPLDDLLSSASPVPEISEEGLRRGRQALDAAIAQASAPQSPAHRRAAARWWGSWRGMTVIGATATFAAAAVVAGAVVLPSSATPSKTASSKTAPTSKATAKAKSTDASGAAVSLSSVSYRIDTTTSSVPAATVLDEAATAIGQQAGTTSEPNVDWSEPYFHTVQVFTCNGQTTTDNVWETRTDDGVGEHSGADCGGPGGGGLYPITAGFADFYGLGNQPLTESQVDQLPTDPNKLWPLLEGFDGDSLGSDTANPHSNASTMFQSIWNLITSEPLSPAFSKALLEDAAKIPGVTVEGKYTDSLGRTGTVLHIGVWTMAIDTSTGQVLAMTQNATPGIPICGGKVPAHTMCQVADSSTMVYVSAELVPSVPKAVASMITYARAHEPKGYTAPAPTPKL
ncbi:MAG TPA: hypothetical protein VMU95_22945 [Trebonia sp.]|nr:hypothetical protein [Trebonia sp.]